jgi:tripeptide aminopeptidase
LTDSLAAALEELQRREPETIREQIELCEIPAPPFGEARRAAAFRDRLEEIGLQRVRTDAEGNVIGELPGAGDGPSVVLSAHLDTVFPEGTEVRVRRAGSVLHAPGIGDDARGLAVVLAVARVLAERRIELPGTLYVVGTVGEEGEGNLRGVRHLVDVELAGRMDAFLSIDGPGLDLTVDGVGSHRYLVTFGGPGGHSYGSFGIPNPVHALGRAIARIAALEVPAEPRTTFSVGVVEGGSSVNAIPESARLQVDLRSTSGEELDALDERVQTILRRAAEEESARWGGQVTLTLAVESIGRRPAARQPADSAIVEVARSAARRLGFHPALGASSTDANYPLSRGIPSLTLDAGGSGQGAHTLAESFDTTDSHRGTQWALLVAAALAGRPLS